MAGVDTVTKVGGAAGGEMNTRAGKTGNTMKSRMLWLLALTLTTLSLPAQLTVSLSPTNQVLAVGGTLTLSATATGTGPLTYQWFKDSRWLAGATNTTLVVSNAGVINAGTYSVLVTNAGSLALSRPALVGVGNTFLLDCGYNQNGQLGNGLPVGASYDTKAHPALVPVMTNAVAAAAGSLHSLLVTADGRLWGMGYNGDGELGTGTTQNTNQPAIIASNVVAVAAGGAHSLFVKADGTLWGMGYNYYGQLGITISKVNSTNKPVLVATNVVAAAAGDSHSLFIKADGTLWSMGLNNYGQLANGTTINTNKPVLVASNVVAVAAGQFFSHYVKSDHTLWGVGDNRFGELGDGTTVSRSLAAPVLGATNVAAVAAGFTHALFLRGDTTLWGMGDNRYGQLGDGTTATQASPVPTLGGTNVLALTAGNGFSLFLQNDGSAWALGYNNYGQLGDGTTVTRTTPVPTGRNLVASANLFSQESAYHTLALGQPLPPLTAATQIPQPVTATNAVLNGMAVPNGLPVQAWFEWGVLGSYTATTPPVPVAGGTSVARVNTLINGLSSTNVYQCHLVVSNATGVRTGAVQWFRVDQATVVTAWGAATNTAYGYGQSLAPSGLTNVMALAGGAFHSLVLATDGTVTGWGQDTYQQTDIPAAVTNVVALGTGYGWNPTVNLALRNDGTVVGWGAGTTVPAGLSNVVAVAAGDTHGLALKADGKVVAWAVNGFQNYGQTNVPGTVTNAIAIGGGSRHSLALTANGKVVVWGDNFYGQLNVPATATNLVAIAAGSFHNLALRADGTVLAWGYNNADQCNVPAGLTNVVAIAAGGFHSLALKRDGTVAGWGDQGGGHSLGSAAVPGSLTNVVAIACGGFHSLALGAYVPPIVNSVTNRGYVNQDLIVSLSVTDASQYPLTNRISILPSRGSLYQYDSGGRGLAITTPDTVITDVSNRVVFVPATNDVGSPYTTFSVVANDGQVDSAPGLITITILRNNPSLTWYPPPITYGQPLDATIQNARASVPGTFQYNPPPGTVLGVGYNLVSVTFTPDDTTNYAPVSTLAQLNVFPAQLTVIPNNAARAVGQPDPVFTGSLAGVQNGDNITVSYRSTATPDSPAGTYAIVPTLADPGNRLGNYYLTIMNGTLTLFLPPQNFTASGGTGQPLTVQLTGTPGYPYALQMATNLTPPVGWQSILTNSADTNGNWSVTVTNALDVPVQFYRAVGQ